MSLDQKNKTLAADILDQVGNQKITQQEGIGLSKCTHFLENVRILTEMHTFSQEN